MGIFCHIALANSVLIVECNIMKDLRSSPTVAVQHRMLVIVGSKRFSAGLFPDLNKESPTKNAVIPVFKRNIDTQQI